MAIKNIINRGIGFSPGKIGYVITHGFGDVNNIVLSLSTIAMPISVLLRSVINPVQGGLILN